MTSRIPIFLVHEGELLVRGSGHCIPARRFFLLTPKALARKIVRR